MGDIKPKFKRYSPQEWIAMAIGSALWVIQVYRYATNTLADNSLEIPVFCIAFLLTFAPLTLLNIIRKARGVDTK